MQSLYVIDAINFLFRSYYGIGPMTSPSGQTTSALYGFIRSLQKLIKEKKPTHLIAVFDGPDNKKKRQALYKDYKGHREKAPEDLFPQFAWAEEYCRLAGIVSLCLPGVEADDAMASIAAWAKQHKANVYLCTSDKDLAQLVDDTTFLLQPHKDYALVDKAQVEALFGVPPEQMLDYLAMVGDASDNIPGIEGFGPKTAASLLKEFGSLDFLLKHPEKVKGAKKQELLRTQREIALLSRKLATLDTSLKIPSHPSDYALLPPNVPKLQEFFQEMGFRSMLKEISSIDPPPASKEKSYHLITTEKELHALIEELHRAQEISLDTETTHLTPLLAECVGIGFATSIHSGSYVPLNGHLNRKETLAQLKPLFESKKLRWIGHHLKYDWHVLQNEGIDLKNISFDTMLASYLIDPQSRRHNLDLLALSKLNHVKTPIEELIGKGKTQISMEEVPLNKVGNYCCEDVDDTLQLKHLFAKELKDTFLTHLFETIELPLIPILGKMEREGIYLDIKKLCAVGEKQKELLEKVKEEIFEEVGEPFNLNSPKQLSEILFDKLKIPKPPKTKTAFATGADILKEISLDHPIAEKILSYRTLEKLRTTYVEALPKAILPKTGKIHCTFNQSVTATGRLSCQDPNLQNIPVRDAQGLAIRSCFLPTQKDFSFLSADYSQIELRLLAHFSQDQELKKAFAAKEDIHSYTASLIFNLPLSMITPSMRHQAKAVNFGILYGQSPFGLSKLLKIPFQEASAFIDTYFERYPDVQTFLTTCKENAKATGFATTLTGRKRPLPEIHSQNPAIRQAAERLAINTPLQGTAADLIKLAMISIDKKLEQKGLKAKMILQIHDELIFEVPDDEIDPLSRLVKKEMEQALDLSIPLDVEISIGKNWAEC